MTAKSKIKFTVLTAIIFAFSVLCFVCATVFEGRVRR